MNSRARENSNNILSNMNSGAETPSSNSSYDKRKYEFKSKYDEYKA